MPWDNNTGGPGRGNGGGPWGKPPTGGGGPRRGGSPNLEDILNRGRERFRGTLPGGGWAIAAGIAVILVVWLYNSIYTIAPQEVGVETTFGVPSNELETQGLHFLFWPVQTVERVNITQNKTDIGSVPGGGSNNSVSTINSVSANKFWDTLVANVKDILRETDKVLPAGTAAQPKMPAEPKTGWR